MIEFKDMGLLLRKEFDRLWNELKNIRRLDGGDSDVNLDQIDRIRVFVMDLIEKEMEKHAADGLGRVDYALASGGARVVRHSEPYGLGNLMVGFLLQKAEMVFMLMLTKCWSRVLVSLVNVFPCREAVGLLRLGLEQGSYLRLSCWSMSLR